ncbi:AAA family ATPase [Agarivorans litoreus]|uniref:AAA family ATPase n=1 Tax=Agarivorans litoreus TaxID=1510455 RepID=UPI001FE7F502|nr:AAA family ATPase [Agarivorans litoreus]
MSTDFFTQKHVALLSKWHGQKSDSSNQQQQADYQELKSAYDIVFSWAEAIKSALFPDGRVKIRRSPVNQGGNFFSYLWAKIYPYANAPESLAYTVHISTEELAVKIDTVNAPKSLVDQYVEIRGDYYHSPIVKCLALDKGLAMSFSDLVAWSIEAIESFELSYDQVAGSLGILVDDAQAQVSVEDNDANYTAKNGASQQMNNTMASPLNQILYGPPGTGKTYHTIEAAVKAAEPSFVWANRKELKEEYDRLVLDKRIRFVTFHQSYGYEEFVEGLQAKTTKDKTIKYALKAGAFKAICKKATTQKLAKPKIISEDSRIWQLSIESSGKSEVKEHCLASNIAAIGWGHVGDMADSPRPQKTSDNLAKESSPNQATLRHFCNEMSKGDIVLCVSGQKTIEAIGVAGDYEYRPKGVLSRTDYCHTREINWLVTGLTLNVYDLNCQTLLPIKTCSELTRFSVSELLVFLEKNNVRLTDDKAQNVENFVLVIDEINRGNISKIFGELITLIEPSKRAGEAEAVELVLPYSRKPFSVPNNLHIIGTMNTADRSLAMMDTALRRRFDFVEMMPKPELLKTCVVEHGGHSIELSTLLTTLNQRIEILYDREHTLGHAFLMPVKALVDAGKPDEAFGALVSVFKNKLIPLLEEYFFEDWSKIRLVLADNQKPEELQFVLEEEQKAQQLASLFGKGHKLDQYGQSVVKYTLVEGNKAVWRKAAAYVAIYDSVKSDSSELDEPKASPEVE